MAAYLPWQLQLHKEQAGAEQISPWACGDDF